MKITIIGAGNMGGAIARGLAKGSLVNVEDITVADPNKKCLDQLAEEYPAMKVMNDNREAVKNADMVLLAVKPWLVQPVIDDIKDVLDYNQIIFASIAAGIGTEQLCQYLDREDGEMPPVYYLIPNTAISVMSGMTFITSVYSTPETDARILALFDELGLGVAEHAVAGDLHLADVRIGRDLVHDVRHQIFDDGAQAARARLELDRGAGDLADGGGLEGELDAVQADQLLVLLDERVFGLCEDLDQRRFVQRLQIDHDGHAADELGDEAELGQILRLDVVKELVIHLVRALDLAAEAEGGVVFARLHDLIQPDERAAADEEDVGRVDAHALLLRVLAAALRRDVGDGAFDDLEERLLHPLARDVARDGDVFALARDLVDLVDVDDAALRLFDVVVGVLDEFEQDVFDVLAHVTGLGEGGRVAGGEGNVEDAREGAGEQRLAAAGGPEQEDVALFDLDVVIPLAGKFAVDALVMVIDRYGQHLFGLVLPDDVLVELGLDLGRLFQLDAVVRLILAGGADLFVADLDAFVADGEAVGAGDQDLGAALRLAAKGTALFFTAHIGYLLSACATPFRRTRGNTKCRRGCVCCRGLPIVPQRGLVPSRLTRL